MAGKEEEASRAEIKWNEKAERFETDDREAFLQYHLVQIGEGKTAMDMAHTFVPRSKRGMGLAAKLCDAAFVHARSLSLPVIPTCSYISDTYLPKNPAWSSLVYKEELKSSM
ncbi:acetyltransferase [Carex littledalei]|uniref:Acetyltransferase n=1 Tax=Carex littledalei TaxID=544730 RepID=A0A833RD83_9POAL|nr:acetyltransferase [Carex littledalei]